MQKTLLSILWAVLLICPVTFRAYAQKASNWNFGADISSRYIWRGINLGGNSPHIQPFMEYTAGNSGLSAGFWGSYGLGVGSAITEADFYLSYCPVELFTLTVTDYFFPTDAPFTRDRYFNFQKGTTGHTIEGMARFNGTQQFPFTMLFAINLYGADGTDGEGNNYNAKYLEAGYRSVAGETGIEAFIGFALDNPDTEQGAEGWYGESGGLINLGFALTRHIRFTETFELPAFSSLIFNPEAGNIYMVIGLTF